MLANPALPSSRNVATVLLVVLTGLGVGYLIAVVDNHALFVPGAYAIIIWSACNAIRRERDWLNPLTLIAALSLVRFTVPWLLLAVEEPPASLRYLRLTAADWQSGHFLILLGLLAVIVGWYMVPKGILDATQQGIKWLTENRAGNTAVAAWAWITLTLGMIGLTLFVVLNASMGISAVAKSGVFRSLTVQEGTGVYFYLSLASIAGSVLLTSYLIMHRRHHLLIALWPVLVVGAAFFVLGGRSRSFVPIGGGLFIIWHVILKRRFNIRLVLGAAILTVLIIIFSYAGQIYRGERGLSGLSDALSPTNLVDYVYYAAWIDFGQLHALAGATVLGPGILEGRTFVTALGKVAEWLNLSGKSGGVFIVQELVGIDDKKWGFHPTFIGDCYLDFGIVGIGIFCTIFGAFLRSMYHAWLQMVDNPLGLSFCTIIILYSLRIFFGSVGKVFEMSIVGFFSISGPFLSYFFRRENGFV